jgi:hypothetical protein
MPNEIGAVEARAHDPRQPFLLDQIGIGESHPASPALTAQPESQRWPADGACRHSSQPVISQDDLAELAASRDALTDISSMIERKVCSIGTPSRPVSNRG